MTDWQYPWDTAPAPVAVPPDPEPCYLGANHAAGDQPRSPDAWPTLQAGHPPGSTIT